MTELFRLVNYCNLPRLLWCNMEWWWIYGIVSAVTMSDFDEWMHIPRTFYDAVPYFAKSYHTNPYHMLLHLSILLHFTFYCVLFELLITELYYIMIALCFSKYCYVSFMIFGYCMLLLFQIPLSSNIVYLLFLIVWRMIWYLLLICYTYYLYCSVFLSVSFYFDYITLVYFTYVQAYKIIYTIAVCQIVLQFGLLYYFIWFWHTILHYGILYHYTTFAHGVYYHKSYDFTICIWY